jgi:hypothetical protein
VIRAIATIEPWSGTTGVAFRIIECPSAPEHEGGVFAASRELRWRAGQRVSVKFHPDDQYAYEIYEIT